MRFVAVLLALLVSLPLSRAGDGPRPADAKPKSAIVAWDTGTPSAEALAPEALAGKNDWKAVPGGQSLHSFAGDAVVSNGRIALVLRKHDSGAAVLAVSPAGTIARFRLRLETANGEPASRLKHAALVENGKGSACIDATFDTTNGEVAAKFRIKRGDVLVQVEPGAGAAKLRLDCPSRFVVLPDFFADDLAIDAVHLPAPAAELPSDNFVLHLFGEGDAIAMCVFENRQHDVKVTLAGEGERRQVDGSEIGFEGKKVWVALLEAPHIWHHHELKSSDTGKVIPLGWRMPFPAQWRVDMTRTNDLTDSWEMLLQKKQGGDYVKPSWLGGGDEFLPPNRQRWNTVLGFYPYPCYSDPDGQGYIQPPFNRHLLFRGPVFVYPINRVKKTPLTAYTVLDVMRNTLGVGPCEHILDLEAQKEEYRGQATCSVRDTLLPIYKAGRQKEEHALVDKTLDNGLIFVKHIRGRIVRYVEFERAMLAYLAKERKVHPELGAFIDEMEKLTREIDQRYATRDAKIKTPEHVARMNEDFRRDVLDYSGPDAFDRASKYANALVTIGDNQDELSGECRWVVRALRQRAGIWTSLDPRVAPLAAEIRARTQAVLRYPSSHEGPRH